MNTSHFIKAIDLMKCEIWKLLNFNSLFLTKFSCTLLIVGNIEASQFLIHFLLLNLVVGCWLYVHYDNINLQLLNCSRVLYRLVTIRCDIYIQNNLTIKFLMSNKLFVNIWLYFISLLANPLANSPGQVKLGSDKWKLWKKLFE
jgi:hypothetical protein